MAGLALPRPGLVGRKRGNGREIRFERIITAMRNCDLRMLCLAIPGWPPSHLFLRIYSSPFFFFLLLGIPTRRSQPGCFFISPLTPTSGRAYPESKKKKINICSTYLFALDSCSFNKQADNPRKQKKKTDPCLGMQAFFCPQQPNIPFLSWGFACKSEKKFFKQSLHRLTVIRSFLPIHIWVLSFQKKGGKPKTRSCDLFFPLLFSVVCSL